MSKAARASVGRSFTVLSIGQIVSRLLAFAVIVHLTRVLGPEGFGFIVFAVGVLGYAALLIEVGLDTLGPLEVARGGWPVPALARAVVTLRLLLFGGALGVVLLFAWLAPVPSPARLVIVVYGLSLLANALDLGWVFLGDQRMEPVAVAEIASQALQAAGAFLLVREGEHLLRMPWIFVASRLAAVGGLLLAFRRRHGALTLPGFDRALLRRLLAASLPLSGATAVGTLLQSFDLVLLGLWRGALAAGVYGAAQRVAWVPSMLATSYFTSLRPALARGSAESLATVAPVLGRSLRLALAVGIGMAVGGGLLARPLVDWLYGEAFAEAAAPLRLLLGSVALLLVSRHFRALLQVLGRTGLDFRIMVAASAANVSVNLLLVPKAGLIGAATASLVSEALILALSLAAARPLMGGAAFERGLPGALAGILAGAALMTAAVLLAAALPVPSRIALGAVVYGASLLAFRVGDLRRGH
jgi:O-antigen/teichoic acid export membrane protein